MAFRVFLAAALDDRSRHDLACVTKRNSIFFSHETWADALGNRRRAVLGRRTACNSARQRRARLLCVGQRQCPAGQIWHARRFDEPSARRSGASQGHKSRARNSSRRRVRSLPKITERSRSRRLMKSHELARAKIGKVTPPSFEHINRQIPPEPHTAMYVWHKYWSRKTWNVVGEHIKAYTKEHQIVFEPRSR